MRYLTPYRLLIRLMPKPRYQFKAIRQSMGEEKRGRLLRILRLHRARGGVLAQFDREGITDQLVYGQAGQGQAVQEYTAFRAASVSKTITASAVLALMQQGRVDLDADLDRALPYSLRHPRAPQVPITLRMLLTHTAGIKDGKAYHEGLTRGMPAGDVLKMDSHTDHLPGEGCEYSNFGVGLVACALEALLQQPFEQLVREALFSPLGMQASYYPFLIKGPLASARRVLPPARQPGFDAAIRQHRVIPGYDQPDPQLHYTLAQGSCCLTVQSLAMLGQALLAPGFFNEQSLQLMRSPLADLSGRDPSLMQGLGLFILKDKSICKDLLYGHQGMAYGAVNMLFFDVKRQCGLISLTSGASEAREYILADINKALLRTWQEDA